MAGLWFKVAADLPRHGKSLALAHRLEDRRAWSYVVQMWGWFCEQQGGGILTGPNAAAEIAGAAGWEGDPEHFCAQMVAVGFLDVVPEGFKVHGWEEWAGYHVEAQKRDNARKKASRSTGCPSDVQRKSDGHPEDIQRKSSGPLSTLSSGSVASGGGAGGGPLTVSRQRAMWATEHPLAAALLDTLKAGGLTLSPPRQAHVTEQVEEAVRVLGEPEAVQVVVEAHRMDPNPSLGWYARALHSAAAAAPVAEAPQLPEPGCPEWGTARQTLRERVRPDLWDRWFRPLVGRVQDGALVLSAPTEHHAAFVADAHVQLLTECAGRPVRIEAAP